MVARLSCIAAYSRREWPAWLRVACALAIAATLLFTYAGYKIDAEAFGLATGTIQKAEVWKEMPFTASYVEGIQDTVASLQRSQALQPADGCSPLLMLWLGNSQLHYIKDFREGDHTGPYWLRRQLSCPEATIPLALSLAHATMQEQYVLTRYVQGRLPVRGILLQLSFNDFRQDGLREEFASLLTPADRAALRYTPVGASILSTAEAMWKGRDRGETNPALAGFVQKPLEDWLDAALSSRSRLWAERKYLRSRLHVDLYELRNLVFRIKATTQRRVIPLSYDRNMQALRAVLGEAQERGIAVVAYVAPIRRDVPLPYDLPAYRSWKAEAASLAAIYSAGFQDLETAVPDTEWGSAERDIDFTHLTAKGHELLARALLASAQLIRDRVDATAK